MKTRRWILSGLLAAGALVTTGCGDAVGGGKRYPDFRYRLTVEVDTPEGLKSGSSVIEVKTRVSGKNEIPSPRTIYSRVRGEAVTVGLGKRGLLFALLRTEYDVDWAAGVLSSAALSFGPKPENNFDARMKRTLALQGRYDLPLYYDNVQTRVDQYREGGELPSYYPIMVRFGDLSDPKSVEQVDPYKLDESFGKGVKLKRITPRMRLRQGLRSGWGG